MKIPKYVKNCIETLGSAGYSAYAVGGAVRDSLLGLEPSDWDVTTSAPPKKILEIFAEHRTVPTGIKHGTVTVMFEDGKKSFPIEITTFRIDGEYKDSRHPETVSFASMLSEDLSRRDFTVNAMAYNENEGLVDLFCGRDDLERGIIRTVGEPTARFEEDALRILRAFRFCAQIGFEFDEKTLNACASCAPLLKNISRERIGTEIKKLLAGKRARYSLEKMMSTGVWSALFDVPEPDSQTVSRIEIIPGERFEARLSALICHLSDAEKDGFFNSLRLSNSEKKLILRLCKARNFTAENKDEDELVLARKFLRLYGDIWKIALCVLEFWQGDRIQDGFSSAVARESEKGRCLAVSDLKIRGGDILPLCSGNYALVGVTLERLLCDVIVRPELNEREKLLSHAEKIISEIAKI